MNSSTFSAARRTSDILGSSAFWPSVAPRLPNGNLGHTTMKSVVSSATLPNVTATTRKISPSGRDGAGRGMGSRLMELSSQEDAEEYLAERVWLRARWSLPAIAPAVVTPSDVPEADARGR